jgi:hypothetical protein
LRATAVQYAGKLAGSAAPIDEGTRGLRKRMLGTATARLRERLGALGDVALEQLMSDLQMRDPRVVVPVYPFVGLRDEHAIVRSSNGADSCLVAVGELTDAQELHVVLHLATNALDLATRDQNSVLSKLRGRLGERASRWPSRVQALISAEAEAVMLRVFGEDARDARNVHGWGDEDYLQVDSIWRESSTDLGRTYAAVRDAWTRYLAGELTLEQALEAIAAEG